MKLSIPLLFSTAVSASSLNRLFKRQESGVDVVLQALQTLQNLTIDSQNTIEKFTGNLTDALAISTATTGLINATYDGVNAVQPIANLSASDATILGSATQDLAYSVNASIATLISKKPEFDNLSISSLVVTSLQPLLASTYVFSVTVLEKIPSELQIISAALSSQIGASISQGIHCFNGTASACITTIANPNRTRYFAIQNEAISEGNPAANAAGFTALAVAFFAAVIAF